MLSMLLTFFDSMLKSFVWLLKIAKGLVLIFLGDKHACHDNVVDNYTPLLVCLSLVWCIRSGD